MTIMWQQEILKAIDESFVGNQGVYLDAGTTPLAELKNLTLEQSNTILPGTGNSVANQVKHLVSTIAMHKPQFMGGEYPDLDWGADWSAQQVTAEEWRGLLQQLDDGREGLKSNGLLNQPSSRTRHTQRPASWWLHIWHITLAKSGTQPGTQPRIKGARNDHNSASICNQGCNQGRTRRGIRYRCRHVSG